MASKRIDITVNGKDNTAAAMKQAASNIKGLGQEANKAGSTIGAALNKGTSQGISGFNQLGSAANSAFGSIKAGAAAASSSLGGLQSAIAGIIGGFGTMQAIESAWQGATQRQFNEMYLKTKMSTQAAQDYIKEINRIVSAVPGNDTWMNALLSGALAKQTNLSVKQLENLGWIAAKYVTASQQTGAAILPVNAEREISQYIKTGNTSLMVRDGLLRNQISKLENIKTVDGRIAALQTVMTEEGYMQLEIQDLASAKWEVIKGKIGLAAANVGTKLLPLVEKVLDTLTWLDDKTNGWSTTVAFVGTAIAGLAVAAAPFVMATIAGAKAMKEYATAAWSAAAANKANTGPGMATTAGTAGGVLGTGASLSSIAGGIGVILAAAVATGAAFKTVNDALKGTHDTLKMMIASLPTGGAGGGVLGAMLFGENFTPIEIIASVAGPLGQLYFMITSFWGQVSSISGISLGSIRGAVGNTASYISSVFGGAINRVIGLWNGLRSMIGSGINAVINVSYGSIQGAINSARSLLGTLQTIAGRVWTAIAGGARGPGGISNARGPGIGLHYENYAGTKKNAWNAAGTGLSGNCVDMTLGLMSAYGGSMVQGTWNGGSHVWWQSPSGQQLDPARKALEGTWNPPARGPGNGNFGNITINGDVYGFDDFAKKVEQASGRIGLNAGIGL